LYLDHAAHRVDHAREFEQQSVAGGLDDTSTVRINTGIDYLATKRLASVPLSSRPIRRE
jgi:hypothetical protein